MNFIKAYHKELACWRLSLEQRGLLIAFLYCMKMRMEGVDFDRHWAAMCGEDPAEQLGRDYVEAD